jgi:hypothetical protein
MVAKVVLGRVCIGTRHELGYAQFAGQQHHCLFGLRLLLDTSLGQWLSTLDAQGDLFLDKFSSSGLPFLELHFFMELGLLFCFHFLWFHLLLWFLGLLTSSLSPHLYKICLQHVQIWGDVTM